MIWACIFLLTTCPKPDSLVYYWQKADSTAEVRWSRGGDTQPPTPALMMSLLCWRLHWLFPFGAPCLMRDAAGWSQRQTPPSVLRTHTHRPFHLKAPTVHVDPNLLTTEAPPVSAHTWRTGGGLMSATKAQDVWQCRTPANEQWWCTL